jgi:MFS family permease
MTSALATYAGVLRQRTVLAPFLAAVLARLPIAMTPLGIVLLVQAERGSYGIAGVVTGAFALGTAAGAPVWGRLMDRHGQTRVLVPTVLTSALLIAGLAVGTVADVPSAVLVVVAAAAGGTFPPFSAAMRSTWRRLLPEGAARRAGFALDAVAVESLFVGGPLFLSLLLLISPPIAPLLVTAALLAAGGLAYSWAPAVRSQHRIADSEPAASGAASDVMAGVELPPTGAGRGSRVMVGALPLVLAISAVMAIGFGVIDTSIAATARQVLGDPASLGVLFAAIAGASVVGGLLYGTRSSADREHRRLPLALGMFAVSLAPVPFLLHAGRPPLWSLLPLLFLAGLAIAPALIMLQHLVDRSAPGGRSNEAQAWLSTSNTAGGAAGTAAAGLLIDAHGVPVSFGAAVLALLGSSALALAARRRIGHPRPEK